MCPFQLRNLNINKENSSVTKIKQESVRFLTECYLCVGDKAEASALISESEDTPGSPIGVICNILLHYYDRDLLESYKM